MRLQHNGIEGANWRGNITHTMTENKKVDPVCNIANIGLYTHLL